jgi:hypothetical protein
VGPTSTPAEAPEPHPPLPQGVPKDGKWKKRFSSFTKNAKKPFSKLADKVRKSPPKDGQDKKNRPSIEMKVIEPQPSTSHRGESVATLDNEQFETARESLFRTQPQQSAPREVNPARTPQTRIRQAEQLHRQAVENRFFAQIEQSPTRINPREARDFNRPRSSSFSHRRAVSQEREQNPVSHTRPETSFGYARPVDRSGSNLYCRIDSVERGGLRRSYSTHSLERSPHRVGGQFGHQAAREWSGSSETDLDEWNKRFPLSSSIGNISEATTPKQLAQDLFGRSPRRSAQNFSRERNRYPRESTPRRLDFGSSPADNPATEDQGQGARPKTKPGNQSQPLPPRSSEFGDLGVGQLQLSGPVNARHWELAERLHALLDRATRNRDLERRAPSSPPPGVDVSLQVSMNSSFQQSHQSRTQEEALLGAVGGQDPSFTQGAGEAVVSPTEDIANMSTLSLTALVEANRSTDSVTQHFERLSLEEAAARPLPSTVENSPKPAEEVGDKEKQKKKKKKEKRQSGYVTHPPHRPQTRSRGEPSPPGEGTVDKHGYLKKP